MKPILVVDDEAIVRESLRDWLTDLGYQVETAEEGEQALKTVAEQDFGVVILDLRLPGKDGIEILKEARAKRPDLKGVIITAYPSIQTAVQAMKEGAVDYLPKPFALDDLGELIREALGPAAAPAVTEMPVIEEVREEKGVGVEEVIDEATGKVCLPPCQISCPIGENIQRTNVMISRLPQDGEEAYRQIIKIGDEIYDKNPLFMVCSYICGLCEDGCNYKDQTGAIRRTMLKRFITDHYLPYLATKLALPYPTREKIAVIGGGPGGLMCAYELSRKGYQVAILERDSRLGGALRNIPQYRLPTNVIDSTVDNLIRIAHVDVRYGVEVGGVGKTLDDLKKGGYRAIFIATGTPSPRPLTFEGKLVAGAELDGVASGLHLLYEVNQGRVPHQLYRQLFNGRRVIVVGGGNVAFDVARTVRRLGGDVSLVCLENEDKSSKDGIPADVEEIEGAQEEGIRITYSRGVEEIIGEEGKFKKLKCPKCISVFDESGFNPRFDRSDAIYLEGDVLLVTIGQGVERTFLQQEGLLSEKGRLDIDPITLMSNCQEGIFIGGDVKKIGFAAEAMRDGRIVAESIDRYLRGEDLKVGREKDYQGAAIPVAEYQPQPGLEWALMKERLGFEMFERGFTLEEAIREAGRCLSCGPCRSCQACVVLQFQPEIAGIEVSQDKCSGCGVCLALCSYNGIRMVSDNKSERTVVIDESRCKRCGVCASACPSGAITINDSLAENIAEAYTALRS